MEGSSYWLIHPCAAGLLRSLCIDCEGEYRESLRSDLANGQEVYRTTDDSSPCRHAVDQLTRVGHIAVISPGAWSQQTDGRDETCRKTTLAEYPSNGFPMPSCPIRQIGVSRPRIWGFLGLASNRMFFRCFSEIRFHRRNRLVEQDRCGDYNIVTTRCS